MALHEFIVQSDEVGLRLDKFLAMRFKTVSRSRLSLWIKSGFVFVDGDVKPSKYSIRDSEVITVHEPDPTPIEIKPEEMALSIIYEDESLVVINKPPGLVVHPGAGHPDGTLVNGLVARYGALSNIGAPVRPGVVHRIDAGTSGLLVVARTDAAHFGLSKQFAEHTVERRYLALVWDHGLPESGVIETLYGRSPNHRIKFSSKVEQGKRAVTHWISRAELGPCRLLELKLETGRTHQIRVHMADQKNPIVGDPLYGQRRRVENNVKLRQLGFEFGLQRQALHAMTLGFMHPIQNRRLNFSVPIQSDIAQVIQKLGGNPEEFEQSTYED